MTEEAALFSAWPSSSPSEKKGAVGEVKRLEDIVAPALERRLEGLIPLHLTRLLTLKQT